MGADYSIPEDLKDVKTDPNLSPSV